MSDDKSEDDKTSIKSAFSPGAGTSKDAPKAVLFKPDELDLFVNKVTLDAYIFHAPVIENDIERLEYDPIEHSVTVVKKDGSTLDLGVKIQWLVRPYFTKAKYVNIVRTKDGEMQEGFTVPFVHKTKE